MEAIGGVLNGADAVAVIVYEWVGLWNLRTAWINFDIVGTAALAAAWLLLWVPA